MGEAAGKKDGEKIPPSLPIHFLAAQGYNSLALYLALNRILSLPSS